MFRNPKEKNSGNLISLYEFLNLAKISSSLLGVLIRVENAKYLRENQGLDVVKAVLDTLTETGYSNGTATIKVLIQSTDSSVLVDFKKQSKYTVYKIEERIDDILDTAIEDIKKFANDVVIRRTSVFPSSEGILTGKTKVVQKLQKYQLRVYVEVFRNEFISQEYDFFSDPTVQINSYIYGAGINGIITDFPFTAARYKRNRYLGSKIIPPYMSPVQPGGLLGAVSPPALRPAQAPSMTFTDANVTEPPLPPVVANAPTSTLGTPSTNAHAPRELTLSLLFSVFCIFTSMINL